MKPPCLIGCTINYKDETAEMGTFDWCLQKPFFSKKNQVKLLKTAVGSSPPSIQMYLYKEARFTVEFISVFCSFPTPFFCIYFPSQTLCFHHSKDSQGFQSTTFSKKCMSSQVSVVQPFMVKTYKYHKKKM